MNRAEAEMKMGAILAQLEEDTGHEVENIFLYEIEETCIQDENRKVLQGVRISMRDATHRWIK